MNVESNAAQGVEHPGNRQRSLRRMGVFVVLMLPLVLGLGVWQLQRAAYKQTLMDAYFDKLGGLPTYPAGDQIPDAFSRVRLRGRFSGPDLLLDNQISEGQPGYWVYTPFTAQGATWLVNRGWIAAPRTRDELPDVPRPQSAAGDDLITLVAMVWPDTGMLPLFGEQAVEPVSDSVVRMQRLDFGALHGLLESDFADVELRLEAAQPGSLRVVPQTMGFGVERHQGYAFQWFGLAIALVTGYVFFRRSFRRHN